LIVGGYVEVKDNNLKKTKSKMDINLSFYVSLYHNHRFNDDDILKLYK